MSKIVIKCKQCGKDFERDKKEYNRNLKSNQRVFCSRHCQGKGACNFPKSIGNIANFKGKVRTIDEFSTFRWHLRNAKRRSKESGIECNISLEDLKEQWDKQYGICPYTGWVLVNNTYLTTKKTQKTEKTTNRASLDRIDASKGYIKGNIQFIAMIANFAKNTWHENELIKFCSAVYKHLNKQD